MRLRMQDSAADNKDVIDQLAAERANIVTLGTMNGRGYAFFPTDLAQGAGGGIRPGAGVGEH